MEEITNTRLFRLKQRTLSYAFNIVYRPGSTNNFADATLRHPFRLDEKKYAVVDTTVIDAEEGSTIENSVVSETI